jgi:hypothetical protein
MRRYLARTGVNCLTLGGTLVLGQEIAHISRPGQALG